MCGVFVFSLVSAPPSLLLLAPRLHHLSLTNRLSSTALSSTKCHQPKMSPTNCHQPIATHQLSSTNCYPPIVINQQLSTTTIQQPIVQEPTNCHQPITTNQLSSTNLQGVGCTPRCWLAPLGLRRCSAVICARCVQKHCVLQGFCGRSRPTIWAVVKCKNRGLYKGGVGNARRPRVYN